MRRKLELITDYPEQIKVYGSIAYATIGFVLLPLFLTFSNLGYSLKYSESIWVELIFHVVNFFAAVCIFFRYLRESFWNVRLNRKTFLKTTVKGIGAMLAVAVVLLYNGFQFGNVLLFCGTVPLCEVELLTLASDLVWGMPLWGSICVGLLAPITISCLFYATAFAPICCYRPPLAYGAVTLMLAVPRILFSLTFWLWEEQLILFLIQLPFHLIACRLYQKTDTVWAPITALAVVNLLGCAFIFLF